MSWLSVIKNCLVQWWEQRQWRRRDGCDERMILHWKCGRYVIFDGRRVVANKVWRAYLSLRPNEEMAVEFYYLYYDNYGGPWHRHVSEYYTVIESVGEALPVAIIIRDKMQAKFKAETDAYTHRLGVVNKQIRELKSQL